MMQKYFLTGCCIVAFGTVFALAQQNEPARKGATKWEYKVVEYHDAKSEDLTKYGDEGWELVSVIAGTRNDGDFRTQRLYFKRLNN